MLSNKTKYWVKSILPIFLLKHLIFLLQLTSKKMPNYKIYVSNVSGKMGIEIGGPSPIFRTALPIYPIIKGLDGVNFSNETVWEGSIAKGHNFSFMKGRKGYQYISDGTALSEIKDSSYDFVLSSNCLEHIANPLKALLEWRRILRNGGSLVLVLPNKISNFDHARQNTSFDHLLNDFKMNTSEHDLTHLEEILEYHDLSMDPPAGDLNNFKNRSLNNFENRMLHHHVFDLNNMEAMLNYCGFKIIQKDEGKKDFFMLAIKA